MNIITLKSSLWWRTLSLPHIPQVDIYISRDLDSQFSDREEAAVKEWLTSNKSFHFMRDHPSHGTHILGMLLNNRESTKKLPGTVNDTVWKATFSCFRNAMYQNLVVLVFWKKIILKFVKKWFFYILSETRMLKNDYFMFF